MIDLNSRFLVLSSFIFFSACFFTFSVEVSGQTHSEDLSVISGNLRVGDVGQEVHSLQRALNRIPGLQVASSGPGSPGQETSFFGRQTQRAVIRFQEMYADEILSPLGLNRGTGVVGERTRSKLNLLIVGGHFNDSIGAQREQQIREQITELRLQLVQLLLLRASEEAGSTLDRPFSQSEPTDSENGGQQPEEFINPPVISRIEPSSGPDGTKIRVYGQNFSDGSNIIMVTLNRSENYPGYYGSDGFTLEFTLETDFMKELERRMEGLSESDRLRIKESFPDKMEVGLKVVNAYGESEPVVFELTPFP